MFKDILEEKKFTVKFLIILGEITVIVLGVVIALLGSYIYDLNAKRGEELILLTGLLEDLDRTKIEIEDDLDNHEDASRQAKIFLDLVNSNSNDSELLGFYFDQLSRDFQGFPKNSTYLSLRSSGIDFISNDELRKSITELYELHIYRVVIHGRLNPEYSIHESLLPYRKKHFILGIEDTTDGFVNIKNLDVPIKTIQLKSLTELQNDTGFFVELDDTFRMRDYKIKNHIRALDLIDSVKIDIEKEIEYLNNRGSYLINEIF